MMHPNLFDQLRTFQAVTECGSFSAAAKELHKTVSAVTYTVSQLETQLDLKLFDRSGYRPVLTDAGKSVLRDAEMISRKVERLSARAQAMKSDEPANITLLLSVTFPEKALAQALGEFAKTYPHIQFSLIQCFVDDAVEQISEGSEAIALMHLRDNMPGHRVDGRQIAMRDVILAAAPDHPLANRGPFALSELDNHRQIILSHIPVDTVRYDYTVHTTDLWSVNSPHLLAECLVAGSGWSYVERNIADPLLKSGELVKLPCSDIAEHANNRYAAIWSANRILREPETYLLNLIEEKAANDGMAATLNIA